MKYIYISVITCLFASTMAMADKSFTLHLSQELKEGYVLLDLSVELTGDEPFALGASQVYLTDPNDLFDIEKATFVEGTIGIFSGQYDPTSYESLRLLPKQGVLSVWLAEKKSGSGNGQRVEEGIHPIAQIKVPVKNYCQITETTWRINESGFSEYGKKLYSLNPFITYAETAQVRLATAIETPSITISDDAVIKVLSHTTSTFTYQWFKNGEPVSDSNELEFYPTEDGIYNVEVNNECEGIVSNDINYRISSVDAIYNASQLLSAYPNPYVGQTSLVINLSVSEHVVLDLYDINGKKISTILNETMSAGEHTIPFVPIVNTGVSVLKLYTSTKSQTIRLLEVQND